MGRNRVAERIDLQRVEVGKSEECQYTEYTLEASNVTAEEPALGADDSWAYSVAHRDRD